MKPDFTRKLLKWNKSVNKRDMPWKGEPDPYKVWLSEIILQQTRVEQGRAYYEKFIRAYPDIQSLATAPDTEIFKMWEGLGYYSRCKNLITTARYITGNYNGKFPSDYHDLLSLKGIGPYTAAAIASFAFNQPMAVVDGNVLRVLSRYFGISTPIDSPEGKKLFNALAQSLIDKDVPGMYNQAIMDFGATVCKPRQPLCLQCVQSLDCESFRNGYTDLLPVKEKILKVKVRWLYYFIIMVNHSVYIRKREKNDIWQNLHEFVLLESKQEEIEPAEVFLEKLLQHQSFAILHSSELKNQQLTHQRIRGKFFVVQLNKPASFPGEYLLVNKNNLDEYAFPKYINSFLENYNL